MARGAPALRLDDNSSGGPHQAVGGIAQAVEIVGAGIRGRGIESVGEIRRAVHYSSAKLIPESRTAAGPVRGRAFIVWT